MRMHSYNKCNSNLLLGAIIIFSIIVLYNYWNVSTLNRDLIVKITTLEKQVISYSKANEGLASNLEKVQDDKNKIQLQLQQEEMQARDGRDRINLKERLLKDVQNELEVSKQDAQNCRDEAAAQDTKNQNRDKEISDLKEKITTLEAQVFEKVSINDKLEGELSESKQKIEDLQKELANKPTLAALKSTAADSAGAKPVPQPAEHGASQQQEPVLFNDPAVPYPKSWMDPQFSKKMAKPRVHIQDINLGLKGIVPHNSPVILFDDPKTPVKKARFSVLDPPRSPLNHRYNAHQENNAEESQMNANINEVNKEPKIPEPLKQPGKVGNGDAEESQGEREVVPGNDGVGVLALPNQPKELEKPELEKPENQQVQQPPAEQQHGANLDAQEDDKDHRDDAALQDDQSPDGSLGKDKEGEVGREKEKEGEPVVPAPPASVIKQQQDLQQAPLPIPGAHSGQDVREAAHLNNNNL